MFGVYMLTRGHFGRAAATIAALLLALSPVFITYSSLVMSDVPTLFVTICAAVMLVVATSDYVDPIAELDANVGMADLRSLRRVLDDHPADQCRHSGWARAVRRDGAAGASRPAQLAQRGVAVALGFAIPVAWQLHQNSINLGSAFASGYAWWVPEVYGAGGKTFSIAYLFGPTMPRNPHGNVIVYAHDAARTRRDARRPRRSALLPLSIRGGGVRDRRVYRDLFVRPKDPRRAG